MNFLRALAVVFAGWSAAAAERPNVIMILADDLGYGDLSCYGAQKVATPNIDRLAREGRKFTDAHSPSSICTPSRYNLLTGRYAWRTWAKTGAVWANDPLLIDPGRMTVASLLKAAGYETGIVGKWHLGFGQPGQPGWSDTVGPDYNKELKPGPLECGFDYSFVVPHIGQLPHIVIEGHKVVNLDPADPIEILPDRRSEFRRQYSERPREANPVLKVKGGTKATYQHEELAISLTEKAVNFIKTPRSQPFFLYFAHRNVHGPIKPNPRFAGKSAIGAYGDFILELDWSVGEILNVLDQRKLTPNTLVLFSSDNGGVKSYRTDEPPVINGHAINGKLRGMKTEIYEGGQRVPLLARWPQRIPAGTTGDQLIALTDLLATLAALSGRELPANAGEDSVNLLPALLGEREAPGRRSLIMDSWQGLFAVRAGPWKLIVGQGGGGIGWSSTTADAGQPPGQLYNLESDLGERRNLYGEFPEVVSRLTTLLHDSRNRPGSSGLAGEAGARRR